MIVQYCGGLSLPAFFGYLDCRDSQRGDGQEKDERKLRLLIEAEE